MAISLSQVQKQSQRLVMTPLMQQSIQLLQMSSLELEQMAYNEMLENPFLDIAEETELEEGRRHDDEDPTPDDPDMVFDGDESMDVYADSNTGSLSSDGKEYSAPSTLEFSGDDASPAADGAEQSLSFDGGVDGPAADTALETGNFEQVDVDWSEHYDDRDSYATQIGSNRQDDDGEERDFTEYTSAPESLYESLMYQLRISVPSGRMQKIGEYILGSLDPDGYLRTPLSEIAAACRGTEAEVEQVLRIVQTFEPVGVGARNLVECLTIQLTARGHKDKLVFQILESNFDLLQKKKFKEIAKDLGVEIDRVVDVFNLVAKLQPKPGASRTAEQARYITPDVVVSEMDGKYLITMNEGRLSGLRINEMYRGLLQQEGDIFSEREKDFATEKFRSAMWLIRNIEKRKNTVLKVTEAIMEFQKDFLDKGLQHLHPLTLKMIAERVGMHESTVARVTSNKYVDTPRGTYELKFFFSSGLETDSGENASSTSIKDIIAKLIADEDPSVPLSDQRLAEILQGKGINIARRTVAKYREQLRILSAKLRRKV